MTGEAGHMIVLGRSHPNPLRALPLITTNPILLDSQSCLPSCICSTLTLLPTHLSTWPIILLSYSCHFCPHDIYVALWHANSFLDFCWLIDLNWTRLHFVLMHYLNFVCSFGALVVPTWHVDGSGLCLIASGQIFGALSCHHATLFVYLVTNR